MERFLILKLDGVLQSWGTHTFEDYRPSQGFPTLSGVLGLLGACLGVERADVIAQQALADSVTIAVRADRRTPEGDGSSVASSRITDFHTVLDARKVGGKTNEYPVVSRREYLCDAPFTVALAQLPNAAFSLDQIAEALRRPIYTPSLGRRSCALSRPLFEGFVESAAGLINALRQVAPIGGVIYAETDDASLQQLRVRDQPITGRSRQFATRRVGIHPSVEPTP